MINVFEPSVSPIDFDAIRDTLDSKWLGRGEKAKVFEQGFANLAGAPSDNFLSVTSCTEALFLIMQSLPGVKRVIIPDIHFIGAYNAAIAAGKDVILCDVDKTTLMPTMLDLLQALNNLPSDPYSTAIILLHYGGYPWGNMKELVITCESMNLVLIEDAACAMGSRWNNKLLGTFGDYGVWSFDAMKMITTAGDGGMIYAKNPSNIAFIKQKAYLGQVTLSGMSSNQDEWWEFTSDGNGRRSLMNDVSASMGISQLRLLDKNAEKRKNLFRLYDSHLFRVEWIDIPPNPVADSKVIPHFYWIQLRSKAARNKLARFLRDNDIYTTFRYWPISKASLRSGDFPGAYEASDRTLLLPLHSNLGEDQVDLICEKILEFPNYDLAST
jgi:aminotransferase